jgi:hypothetical protein
MRGEAIVMDEVDGEGEVHASQPQVMRRLCPAEVAKVVLHELGA